MNPVGQQVEELIRLLEAHKRIMIFTGAGVSVDSGIPDFRSGKGIWSRIDPMTLSRDRLMGLTGSVESFWSGMHAIWTAFGNPRPNPIHLAISKLQELGRVSGIVTQNIDGLHQAGGNPGVIELHGNQRQCLCMDCGRTQPMKAIMERIGEGDAVPACLKCGGQIRPQIVLFGDPLSMDAMNRAQSVSCTSDLCLVLGSSLLVTPAADLPRIAYANGARLAILTVSETPLDHLADFRVRRTLSQVFVPAVDALDTEPES